MKKRWRFLFLLLSLLAVTVSIMVAHLPSGRFVSVLFLLAGVFFALLFGLSLFPAASLGGRIARWVYRISFVCFALFLISFLVVEILLLSGARSDPEQPLSHIIVLGAGLNGETPSLALQSRLQAAISYLESYPDAHVIVSGGQGEGETIPEAEAMRRYLMRGGIAESRILVEDQSASTADNIRFSRPLIPEGVTKVGVVSNEFHLCRARVICRDNGLDPVAIAAPTPYWYLKILYYIREYFTMVYYWVF